MIRLSFVVLCAILPLRQVSFAAELPPRNAITRVVTLSGADDSSPLIGCPISSASGIQHGRDIARVLRQRFGVTATVVSADQIDEQDYERRTVILLGNIASNPEILWLYSFNYSFADAAYPGGDGYVIRRIHDPVGAARNALVIGAGSAAGLAKGVRRFCNELERIDAPHWKRELIVKSDLDIVAEPPPPLEKADDDAVYKESLRRMKDGQLWQEAHTIIHAAHAWYMSGEDVYLQRYDAMTRAHRALTDSQADQFYGGLEFWLPAYIQAWDIVEEAEFWTNEQRDRKTQLLIDLANVLARRYNNFAGTPSPRPRWNHETQPALAYFYLARYLATYRSDVEPAPTFRRQAELVLGNQTEFVRGTDESGLYLAYAPANALRYAIASRQDDMVESGRARRFGQLLHMMTDNTGRFVGAANRESENIAYYYLLPLAAVSGAPALAGLDRKTRLAVEQAGQPRDDWGVKKRFGEYRPPMLTPDPARKLPAPKEGTGVKAFPMDSGLFALTNAEPFYARVPLVKTRVTLTRAFDKLVYRDGYGKDGQYLLLDGFGRGRHYRYDTNAILRLTADDRVFLVGTDDDQRVAETYHNTLSFIRDGRGHDHVPPFAALEAIADFPHTSFSSSTVHDYSGLKWTRNITWLKRSLFVVIDHVEALVDGEYNIRCHWNGLGRITIDGAALRLEQNGRTCTVAGDGLANISVSEDRSDAAMRWSGYPHAAPVIHRVRQTRSLKMCKGDRASMCNVICTHDSAKPPDVVCRVVTPDLFAFTDSDGRRLFCVRPEAVPAPFSSDAKLALFEEQRITLVQATSLRKGNAELFHATEPVDCELNVAAGTVSLSRESRGKSFTWKPSPGLRAALMTVLTNHLDDSTPPHPDREAIGDTLTSSETELSYTVRTALVPPAGGTGEIPVIVGASDGCRALRVDEGGKVEMLWHSASESPVAELTRGNRNSGDMPITYGTDDGDVVSISHAGKKLWRRRLTASQRLERQVTCMMAADTDLDGRDEVFVGTGSWNVHAFDDSGRELWKTPAYARHILSMASGDLSGNGAKDLLIGTSYYTLNAYNAQGQVLFGHTGEARFQHVIISDLDGDLQPEAVVANGTRLVILEVQRDKLKPNAYVKGMNLPRATASRLEFDTGDQINVLQVDDVNGDMKPEIFAGTESGYVYCFDGDGKLLHMRNTGGAIRALAVGRNMQGTSIVAAAIEDRRVVVLNAALNPIGEAKFKRPVRWLGVRADGLLCITPQSIGMISGIEQ
jgi:outer membrane protein assembly factor BamB